MENWQVANSGGRVIKGGIGHPETIVVLETVPLKITPEIEDRAYLIAAAPALLAACEWTAKGEHHRACKHHKNPMNCNCYVGAAKTAIEQTRKP